MVGDDARLLRVIADPAERLLGERLRLAGGEPDPVPGNVVYVSVRRDARLSGKYSELVHLPAQASGEFLLRGWNRRISGRGPTRVSES